MNNNEHFLHILGYTFSRLLQGFGGAKCYCVYCLYQSKYWINWAINCKSHTCDEGGAYFSIYFWQLLMNFKNNNLFTKKMFKWTNKEQKKIFFFSGFTPCKVEQPLRSMELQEKKHKKDYRVQKICLERTYS